MTSYVGMEDTAARALLAADPQCPQYHLTAPGNWLNDPNGLMQWQGLYHVFYQYTPDGPFSGVKYWAHVVSRDLAHWHDLPVALAPTPGTADADGCWSGCAVNDQGVPTFIYSGHSHTNLGGFQLPCLAIGDSELHVWTKAANPIIAAPPAELDLIAFRDHSVWREDDAWYMVIGAGIRNVGGTAVLYRSENLRDWEYLHPLCVGDLNQSETLWTGSMWECPDFFALGDRHVLCVSVWDRQHILFSVYMTGAYAEHRFTPQVVQRLDLGDSFYAPQSMRDAQGRRLMWGWLREEWSQAAQNDAGWSGAMSLPRVLDMRPDGTLAMQPAPELSRLRGAHVQHNMLALTPTSQGIFGDLRGDCLELIAEWAANDAEAFGLKVRCSPDDQEATYIIYDRANQRLLIDRTHSSLNAAATRQQTGGACALAADEPLRLQIFLDRSVIEIFANGRTCLAARVYPSRADSLGVDGFVRGGNAMLTRLDAWEIGRGWSIDA